MILWKTTDDKKSGFYIEGFAWVKVAVSTQSREWTSLIIVNYIPQAMHCNVAFVSKKVISCSDMRFVKKKYTTRYSMPEILHIRTA